MVAIPKMLEIHIQNIAPTPPSEMALATPTILPVPIAPARAVAIARNGVILPFSADLFSLEKSEPIVSFHQSLNLVICKKPSLNEKNIPIKSNATKATGPHTTEFIAWFIFTTNSTNSPSTKHL